jgi:diguanylate cyclase (GGDEF)-like protein
MPASAPDYKLEGRDVEIKLIRALALGGKRSVEIQLLLDSQIGEKANFQALSLVLADLSVPEKRARVTFEKLRAHQIRLREALGRFVGIKAAAMDYLENVELALGLRDDESALTYSQLAQMAFQDQLSGLANFRYFTTRFNEEIKRAERYKQLLSILMIDLDRFKKFNDTHGHLAGNKALEHVAAILKAGVRETDLVARYGGEEFAVILPQTGKHDALTLAEELRRRIETKPVEIPDTGPVALSASLGLATFPRDARSAEALVAGADIALYSAKKAGRNRVTTFLPPTIARFSYAPNRADAAETISVVGDFNGWQKDIDEMQPVPSGGFILDLNLVPGRYAYKFVINGEFYVTDPLCRSFAHDGYGGRNSILVVE